jgi:N-methylhydantoinase A
MKFTIDIDNGGTFTDGFFTSDGRIEWVKVDTTPHDLTVCFLKCIEEGASKFGLTVPQMLHETEVIRFSTTHATNTLIQKSGPRLGLIVTKGFEESLYTPGATRSTALDSIIPSEMVVGIDEQAGKNNVDTEQVRLAIRNLLGHGARIVVVSLHQAHLDPANELKVRQIADEDYPKHYLGAVPMLLSTEVSTTPDDASRTNVALLNAYFHPDMVRFLYKAEDDVRQMGYRKPLLVVHADGGAARIAKTTAIMTYNSGPSAGVLGTAFMSQLYNLPYVTSLDIGGTSTDIGLVISGRHGYKRETLLEGIPVKIPVIEVYPAAAGGGSIARPKNKGVQVGPDSAGAMPGPACYGLGGMEATSTDASVVLGYIDPNYFLGGKRTLDAGRAREVIEENVAKPMGISVEGCARLITEAMEDICADDIRRLISETGYRPKDFVLFSFGGAGGMYCCGIAEKVGIPKIYTFQFSSVFGAFGSSCADVLHTYESLAKKSITRKADKAQLEGFNAVVRDLMNSALRDMRGEGFPPEKVSFALELSADAGNISALLEAPMPILKGQTDVNKILDTFATQNGLSTVDELSVNLFRLRATSPVIHPVLAADNSTTENPEKALREPRDVYWKDKFSRTAIYEQRKLECGNVILGPAIIQSEDTTILLPEGRKYTVDNLRNGIIESA